MTEVGDLIVKFQREEHKITGLVDTDTVSDLKNAIYKATQVCPERQKLLGLKVKGIVLLYHWRLEFGDTWSCLPIFIHCAR